jgi:hypothetical protein
MIGKNLRNQPHPGASVFASACEEDSDDRRAAAMMLQDHATHEAGGNGVEAGITEMLERMQTGRFKVFRGQDHWTEEFRYYRREDGLIVKERDDLISSTRYAIMMRRSARQPPSVEKPRPKLKHSGWAA